MDWRCQTCAGPGNYRQARDPEAICAGCGDLVPALERIALVMVEQRGPRSMPETNAPERRPVEDTDGVTIAEACALLGCRKSRLYELMAAGKVVRLVRVGRVTMLSRASIEALRQAPPLPPRPIKRAPRAETARAASGPSVADRIRALRP
jgi:hypothetical protein